jgi:nicotinamide mononucleotide (NMN) deamidase PncC
MCIRDSAETAWVKSEMMHFDGDRAAVRAAATQYALKTLLDLLQQ